MPRDGTADHQTLTESIERREAIREASQRGDRKLRSKRESACVTGAPEATRKQRKQPAKSEPACATDAPAADLSGLSVFVAYAREDQTKVAKLVRRLRKAGAGVIWDKDFGSGTDFRQEIGSAIVAADAVVVVWSKISITSPFVKDEADLAVHNEKYFPTHVGGLCSGLIPLGFRQFQSVPMGAPGQVESSILERCQPLGAQRNVPSAGRTT